MSKHCAFTARHRWVGADVNVHIPLTSSCIRCGSHISPLSHRLTPPIRNWLTLIGQSPFQHCVQCRSQRQRDAVFFLSLKQSIPAELAGRVLFETVATSTPVKDVLERAAEEVGQSPRNAGDLVVLGRNVSHVASFAREGVKDGGSEARKCLGAVGNEVVISSLRASVLVVQGSAEGF